jgi:flagellar hook protein FlgE
LTLDMSTLSAKAASYTPEAEANGNAPSAVKEFQIVDDGTLYAVYETGARVATYKIPLADVPSADMMSVQPGVVFLSTQASGDFSIGFAQEGGFGRIDGYSVEQSTVDLASELTTMIEAQRNYTANSKVFQTSAELMDVLVNLQR